MPFLARLLISVTFLATLNSCQSISEAFKKPATIRIVDLDGKPVNVKTMVPQDNVQILADLQSGQGQPIEPYSTNATPDAMPINSAIINKYAKEGLANRKNPAVADAEMIQNINQQAEDAARLAQQQAAGVTIIDNSGQNIVQESANLNNEEKFVNLNVPVTKVLQPQIQAQEELQVLEAPKEATKKFIFASANSTMPTASVESKTVASGKIFVQLGLFSAKENANKALNSTQNIANGEVKENTRNSKTTYRALLGPFENKAKAGEVINQLAKAGKEAFIYQK